MQYYNKMNEYINFSNKYTSVKLIFLYSIISVVIITIIFKKNLKTYVDHNWKNVRCRPHMIPFIGLSEYAHGNNYFEKTRNTLNSCADNIILNTINIATKPFLYIAELVMDILQKFNDIIKMFKIQTSILKKIFTSIIKNTTERIEDNISTSLYLHEKLKNLIKKQTAIVEITKHYLASFPILLYSFSHGPIPRFASWLASYVNILSSVLVSCLLCNFSKKHCIKKDTCPICALCFEENTLIQLNNSGHSKRISKLKLMDNIKGGYVLGIIQIYDTWWNLYNYNNVIVSGGHLVYEDKWIRVENSKISIPIKKKCSLYCLITSSHNIFIKDIKFKDFQEIDDIDILDQINYNVLKSCNDNRIFIKTRYDICHTYQWGFEENVKIKINNDYYKIIDIINNKMFIGNIIGFVQIKVTNEKFYTIDDIIFTGSTIIKNDGIWQRGHQLAEKIYYKPSYLYNLITRDNILQILGKNKLYQFRDFIENFDSDLNSGIDILIEKRLNT